MGAVLLCMLLLLTQRRILVSRCMPRIVLWMQKVLEWALSRVQPTARSTRSTRWSRCFKFEMLYREALLVVVNIEGDERSTRQHQQVFLEELLADRGDAKQHSSRSSESSSWLAPSSASDAVVVGVSVAGPQAAR